MKIIWDSDKAMANPKHHEGVTFEEAQQVLLDPFALTHEDARPKGSNDSSLWAWEGKAEFWW